MKSFGFPSRILVWRDLTEVQRRTVLERPVASKSEALSASVREILASVKRGGDRAVRELTLRHDRVDLAELQVGEDEVARAREKLSPQIVLDLEEAIRRVSLFHAAQLPRAIDLETSRGVRCERRFLPIERVGLYVPGGSAPLPSTVVMLGTPARIAGCAVRVLCTPPRPDGSVDPHILVAADLLGIRQIFKVGGAQAIAALAFGTETIPKVDKIYGPGNSWVTEAKLQAAQDPRGAACDLPAGPSEVMVIADARANPAFVAADLLSQAEHGADSQVILVSESRALLEQAGAEVERQLAGLSRREIAAKALENSAMILVPDLADARSICNEYAPEHLILQVDRARDFADGVRNAGSVFIGPWSPESVGDYASGTNHVLPTYGFARAYSGLTTESFLKSITVQELTAEGLAELGPVVMRLAAAEGLDAHANAVRVRVAGRGE